MHFKISHICYLCLFHFLDIFHVFFLCLKKRLVDDTMDATSSLTYGSWLSDLLLTSLIPYLNLCATDYSYSWWFLQRTGKVSSLCNDDINSEWFMQSPRCRLDTKSRGEGAAPMKGVATPAVAAVVMHRSVACWPRHAYYRLYYVDLVQWGRTPVVCVINLVNECVVWLLVLVFSTPLSWS
jgi:hypothetical protein